MIIIVKQPHEEKQFDNLIKWIKGQCLEVDMSKGHHATILGLVGDTSKVMLGLGVLGMADVSWAPNASITTVVYEDGVPHLASAADASHLAELQNEIPKKI